MAEIHCLETTSEQTRHDGVIISSTDLRIYFEFVWGHDGYFDPITGTDVFPVPDEVFFVRVDERTPEGWCRAAETHEVLAEYLIDEKPELFYNHVRKATVNV